MLHRTKAIVLHSIKYGESGIIIQAYTEKFGRQSFLVQGVRKKKNKISPSLFQPLTLLDIIAYFKETRDIQKVKEIKPSVVLNNLSFDIRKSSIALFLSEIMYRTLREVEPNLPLFEYIYNAVQILDITEAGIENLHLVFLMQFTKFIGIYPKNNKELIRNNLPGKYQLSSLMDCSLADVSKLTIDIHTRTKLLDQLIMYFEDHLEGIGKVKSISVLREIFHQ